jgi:hypothetical protein
MDNSGAESTLTLIIAQLIILFFAFVVLTFEQFLQPLYLQGKGILNFQW